MRIIPISRSILVFWADATFLEAALLATDETKSLAAPVTQALDEFTTTLNRDLSTRRSVIQSNARASIADTNIDGGIRGLFSGALHLVGQDRKRAEFTTLFSTHIGDVVRHALGRQIKVAEKLILTLTMKLYPDAFRGLHAGVLQPLIDKGQAVLEEQRKAEIGRVEGRLDVKAWKEEVNALRLSVYSQLLGIAATTSSKKAWAEAFFPTLAKPGAVDEEDDGAEQDDGAGSPAEG